MNKHTATPIKCSGDAMIGKQCPNPAPINKKVNITLPLCLSQQHYEPFLWELNEDNGDGDCIGTIYGSSQDDKENLEESQTRAAYICKAVNSHDALVESLKHCVNALEYWFDRYGDTEGLNSPLLTYARETLKLAGEE